MGPTHLAGTAAPRRRRTVFSVVLLLALSAYPRVSLGDTPAVCQTRQDNLIKASTKLSDSTCRSGRDVNIGKDGKCTNAYVDQDYINLGTVTIYPGATLFVPDTTRSIETDAIIIQGTDTKPGLFQLGTGACPIGTLNPANLVTITFTTTPSTTPDKTSPPNTENCNPYDLNTNPVKFVKGLQVLAGGQLSLFGARGVPLSDGTGVSWTHLSQPAGPAKYQNNNKENHAAVKVQTDARTLLLAKDVTDGLNPWRPNDWLVVATTSFSPFETEFVQIQSVVPSGTGSKVTLKPGNELKYYHFGSPDPGVPSLATYNAGPETNYGVDERAEVGLISRNIKFTAKTPTSSQDSALHWGGEIKVCPNFSQAKIQGVELEKFGKDKLGSYPIHFHKTGTPLNKPVVNANSIHHSYNKCVTIHSTSGMRVHNTVCARAVGHLFYEEIGSEVNIHFSSNLGLGAMSNDFAIKSPDDITTYWWVGDNLAKINQYDGFNIPNTDKQDNPVHGGCFEPRADGGITFIKPPPCDANQLYVEPASGFWILNPSTTLTNNSIGGCQGIGVGYWYLMPTAGNQKFVPVAPFKHNRVHGCYQGIFDENQLGVVVEPLLPRAAKQPPIEGKSLIARFDGFIATRNRDRGIWMRPTWFVFDNARLATNRDSVTLFSSGGTDGNAPGVWTLLQDSVVVGLSRNNVDRFGPCPKNEILNTGCIDRNPSAKDEVERGYPTPAWNFAGYYIYDGPVRIEHDRFINFNIEPNLTDDDQKSLADFTRYYYPAAKGSYEGDAALGWFQNNQSEYPTTTVVKELSFNNVDLRHQVFTDKVNFGSFADGDKNTAILDLDGSLTGFRVVNSTGTKVLKNEAPISLNNLPINGSSNAVDECLSKGGQDPALEGRPTSLISPGNVAVLEFGALWPTDPDKDRNRFDQLLTFTKDSKKPYKVHDTMDLHGRNGLGLWEPKVSSGYGYTVTAAVDPKAIVKTDKAGIPDFIDVGFTDAVQPDISPDNPFYIRLGVCYTDKNGNHPPKKEGFTVKRGYKSWGGNGVYEEDKDLYFYWTKLFGKYKGQYCHNLDRDTRTCSVVNDKLVCVQVNLDPVTGCPADGFTRFTGTKPTDKCPNSGEDPVTIKTIGGENVKICPYPKDPDLTPASSIDELKNIDGTPVLTKYFYDPASGMLFFNVVQDTPNALGPSPLGSCCDNTKFACDPARNDPACPDFNNPDVNQRESYYPCPPQGCITYTVRVASDNNYTYEPGESKCGVQVSPGVFDIYKYKGGIFEQNPPANENKLAYFVSEKDKDKAKKENDIVNGETIISKECTVNDNNDGSICQGTKKDFPHSVASKNPWCPESPPK